MRRRKSALLAGLLLLSLQPADVFAQKKTNRVIYTSTVGRQIYNDRCAVCHLPDGKGRGGEDAAGNGFPPLIGLSEWLATREGQLYVAHAIIFGPYGTVLVGDKFYYGLMPRFGIRFTDQQIVEVIRYVAEVINKPAPGYKPITEALVQQARRLPDNMDALEMQRNELPQR
ncbi:MAG: cytochrome c [Hydrocarboniphaga sp.]|uniref:c-type cytochrome n=1 Tax=Hydrocarboniphaga sp. TaxID=2033016 RepID=UPI002622C670|nr:cytochrome c [Hydrocarboniphaga sp.]MDB5970531.1 cytochrome c [Hydrocarboniphaga sp.]